MKFNGKQKHTPILFIALAAFAFLPQMNTKRLSSTWFAKVFLPTMNTHTPSIAQRALRSASLVGARQMPARTRRFSDNWVEA